MAGTGLTAEAHHLSNLKKLIESNYGSSVVNSADCTRISNLVSNGKHGYVSPQTLRRFFGFVKTTFKPSAHTLNILSAFCGFEDWPHFVKKEVKLDTQLQDIAAICTCFFEIEIPPVKKNQLNAPYWYAVKNIAKVIYNDLGLYNKIIKTLASNLTAHEYFFERFPPIDKLCLGFANGYKFYMKHKTNPEAQIFSNALLFLCAFLEEDFALAKKYLSAMNKVKNWQTCKIHPIVAARLIGSNIAYCHLNNDAKGKAAWLAILDHILHNNPNEYGHNINSCEFEFMISEYLLLSQCYEDIKVILPAVVKGLKNEPPQNKGNLYYISSHVIYYKALVMTGDFKAAAKVPFVDEPVNWQIENYYALHLLQCKLKLVKRMVVKKELLKQYYHLINSTGFTYFNRLIQ